MLARLLRRRLYSTRKLSSVASDVVNNEESKVEGWAKSVQKRGQMVFVKVEGSGFEDVVQVVAQKSLAGNVQVGSPVSVVGKWQKSQGAQQEMDLIAESFRVDGKDSNPRYDISADNLRKKNHLRARSDEFSSVMRARSRIFHKTHQFFIDREFVYIDTPKLTRNDCEGGGEVFSVSMLDNEKVYLSVSSQLHLEAMTSRLSKVYTIAPAFRAEKQQSHAHLSEFYMLEAELAFVKDVEPMCELVEDYVKTMIELSFTDPKLMKFLEKMGSFRNPEDRMPESSFSSVKWPRIEYSEALQMLAANGAKVSAKSGLSKQNELDLVKHFGNLPIFVTHYPVEQKPFYMARTSDEKTTLSFDLLCPIIGELAGGSVREHSSEELIKRGCDVEWYRELRERGQPTTSGFGIGFERLLQLLFSIRNIKDTIAFPRWHKHCQC